MRLSLPIFIKATQYKISLNMMGSPELSKRAISTQADVIYATDIVESKVNPGKNFYPVNTLCEGMNEIRLEKVKLALEQDRYKVRVAEEIRVKAKNALNF